MKFENVYFINGTAYAGKSTMVKLLAEKYDGKEIEDRLIAAYGRPPCNKEILIRSVKDAVDAAF